MMPPIRVIPSAIRGVEEIKALRAPSVIATGHTSEMGYVRQLETVNRRQETNGRIMLFDEREPCCHGKFRIRPEDTRSDNQIHQTFAKPNIGVISGLHGQLRGARQPHGDSDLAASLLRHLLHPPLGFFSQPSAFHAWLGGVIASEFLYAFGLRHAYRKLEMSTAYPMMRALPLLLLAAVTAAFGFGKQLSPRAVAGLAVVFAGCLLVPLRRFHDCLGTHASSQHGYDRGASYWRSFPCILLVALGTTGYTLCDSQAQRIMITAAASGAIEVSKPMVSFPYYFFRDIPLCAALWAVVLCGRRTRAEATNLWRERSWMPVVAGCCSTATYALVLVAMNYASNVAYVQTFRQIGLVFGLLEGYLFLHENLTPPKVVGVALILVGLGLSVI